MPDTTANSPAARRFFNTAGPCKPELHYMLPPERRVPEVRRLVEQQGYFVVHAPRQVGKTTALASLAESLTAEGRYCALLVTAEQGAVFGDDPGAAEATILGAWRTVAEASLPPELQPPPWPETAPGDRVNRALSAWASVSSRPLVLFIDEIDALRDAALISVLRQLRGGYPLRPRAFPASLGLVGLRDVRDYRVAAGGGDRLGSSSPFNIKIESLTLRNFTRDEIAELYSQHTADTGQCFEPDAIGRAFQLTEGQPWLVNALARQCVEVIAPARDRPITADVVEHARRLLLERKDTHLDSLAERLQEPRVRGVIEPMLAGTSLETASPDDVRYVLDLGLVKETAEGTLDVANPIYRDVIPAALAYVTRASLPRIAPSWLTAEGTLDTGRLLHAFVAFWRQHAEPLMRSTRYHEVAPHLVMMAFLHRVANGGGTLDREYAIGSGRLDLCLRHGKTTLPIELKVWREGEGDPMPAGLVQLDRYLEGLSLATGWLVIFDRRENQPPMATRTTTTTATSASGRTITVVRA